MTPDLPRHWSGIPSLAESTTPAVSKLWDYLFRASIPIVLALGAAVIAHEVRIAKIESNRFTAGDWNRERLDMQRWVEDRYPPQWLKDQLTRLEIKVDRLAEKVK